MPQNPLSVIASRFIGFVPAAPDNQRMGSNGNAQVLSAGSVPIGGFKTMTAAPRVPLAVTQEQVSRFTLLNLLRGNSAEATVPAPTPISQDAPPQAVGTMPALTNESPVVAGASTPAYNPPPIATPSVLAGTMSLITQTPTITGAIAAQNAQISQSLLSRETSTSGGRKTITETFSRTPSVPLTSQSMIAQQTETKGGVKTITRVYSA